MNNTSGIRPTGFCVLVRPKQSDRKTKGGIYIPEQHLDRADGAQVEGRLVAAGPLAWTFDHWPDADQPPQVGDWVIFKRYSGATPIDGADGESYWLIKGEDVHAVRDVMIDEVAA